MTGEPPATEPSPHILDTWEAAMRRGDWEAAWRATDRVELPRRARQAQPGFVRQPEHLVWDGRPWAGQRVLVRCEHGLGDALQFARYCARLRETAREVTLQAPPALLPTFAELPGADWVVDGWSPARDPAHDVALECMELPYAFRDTPATVPASVPYLRVRRVKTPFLPRTPGAFRRLGLVWASSAWDPARSVPLAALAPLAELGTGVRWYSLQRGPQVAEWYGARFPLEPLHRETASLLAAQAALLELDGLVCVDGMVAHLAGALGRPTFLLLRAHADWRWGSDPRRTPWYPTVRLCRQLAAGDWTGTVARLLLELREWLELS